MRARTHTQIIGGVDSDSDQEADWTGELAGGGPALRIEEPSDEKVDPEPPDSVPTADRCDPSPEGVRGVADPPERGVEGWEPPTESADPS